MGLFLHVLAILALAASRSYADDQCSDKVAGIEKCGADSDDDGALAQLRITRVKKALSDKHHQGAQRSEASKNSCTPMSETPFCSGSVCCGDITEANQDSACECCPGGCPDRSSATPGNVSTTGGLGPFSLPPFDLGLPSTTDWWASLTSAPSAGGGGGTECTEMDPQELQGDGPARLKAAGKCGAADCTCSSGAMISVGGCRTCSRFR